MSLIFIFFYFFIVLLCFVNCVSLKWVRRLQAVFSVGKLMGLLIIICFGTYSLIMGRHENFHRPFENSNFNPGSIAVAFYSGIFSYGGWACLNNVIEEIKDPNKLELYDEYYIVFFYCIVYYLFDLFF
jgi:amino acid transporter